MVDLDSSFTGIRSAAANFSTMTLAQLLLAGFILLGHIAVFIYVVNRLHALAWPRPVIKTFDFFWSVFGASLPLALGLWLLQSAMAGQPIVPDHVAWQACLIYFAVCIFAGCSAIFHRIRYVASQRPPELLLSNHTAVVNLAKELGHRPAGTSLTRLFSYLPANEIFQLSLHEKDVRLPRLDPALDGLTITHLSDLHMTGQLSQSFYTELVRQANALQSDLIVITGDIVERRACLDWIAATLGGLRAPQGVFYVVGNHELKIRDIGLVRQTLDRAGLIGLGGRWYPIEIDGCPVILAGNELPWFPPATPMPACPTPSTDRPVLRVLLSHSPDQFDWARERDFDLMLAGHTHGGQVRLPLIGPILAPSRNGIKYAAGTFYEPPTLMHVSRGIAGTRPLRFNCRPELAKLILRAAEPAAGPEQPASS